MALYEHVFLARQDLAQAQVDALADWRGADCFDARERAPGRGPGS